MDKGEGAEVEFKSARGGIPASLWESYSAFANTDGGIIVLGIQEKNGTLALDGLTEETVTRYKKNFWDCAHNKEKVSICLPRDEDVRMDVIDGSWFLTCRIPRASYEQRPVYLTSNPFGNTYRRNTTATRRTDASSKGTTLPATLTSRHCTSTDRHSPACSPLIRGWVSATWNF